MKFENLEIGDLFIEDCEGIFEVFEKLSETESMSKDDGNIVLVHKSFPVKEFK